MTPREAVQRLNKKGMSQGAISRYMNDKGVLCNQATLSRIASGKIDDTGYNLGTALVALCKRRRA